jgi:hypothetical protein
MPRTPDPTREATKAIRERHCPRIIRGNYYERPQVLVELPADLLKANKKAKRVAEVYAGKDESVRLLDAADEALDNAVSDYRTRVEFRAQQEDLAGRLARGEVGPEAMEEILPAHTEDDYLARVETCAMAVGEARKNLAAAVTRCNNVIREEAPALWGEAVAIADRLEQEATAAEALAATARAKAESAAATARNLRLPEAVAALKAAGIGTQGGRDVVARARYMIAAALVSPLDGWATDATRYEHPEAAQHLGVYLQHPERMSVEEYRRLCCNALAIGAAPPPRPAHLVGAI